MANQPEENEISSLIRLMDDEDDYVWEHVRKKLISIGEDVLPFLDMAVRDENLVLRRRALEIIDALLPNQIGEKIRQLTVNAKGGDIDLEQGVMILTEYGYPGFDSEVCTKALDELAEGLKKNIPKNASPERIVRELTHFLFIVQGFKGDKKNFFDKDNSYFNKVLSQKKGLPISLSVICILISSRLNLNIVGIGLPCHFIVMHNTPGEPIYFDPFHRGKVLTVDGCKELVNSFGFEFKETQLNPVSNRDILLRMIHNLEVTFNQSNQQDDAKNMADFAGILTKSHQKKTPNR